MSTRTAPPFRADHVGSLLRPPQLHQARERHAPQARIGSTRKITPVPVNHQDSRKKTHGVEVVKPQVGHWPLLPTLRAPERIGIIRAGTGASGANPAIGPFGTDAARASPR